MKIQAIALLGIFFAILLFSITSSASAAQRKVLQESSKSASLHLNSHSIK